MDKKIIEKLKQDEHYYGDYGKQFLSNSDVSILLKNPKMLREPKPKTSAMVVGGYFHTAILEPDKLKSFKIDYQLFFMINNICFTFPFVTEYFCNSGYFKVSFDKASTYIIIHHNFCH